MNGRAHDSNAAGLGLMFLMVLLTIASVAGAQLPVPPLPARIGGAVLIDGVGLTQAASSGLEVSVVRLDGSEFDPPARDFDGLNTSDWYVLDIPAYDPDIQPTGAQVGDTVRFRVSINGLEQPMSAPPGGLVLVGDSGSTTQVDIAFGSLIFADGFESGDISGWVDVPVEVTEIGTVTGTLYNYNVAISPDGGRILVGDEHQSEVTSTTHEGAFLWNYSLPVEIEAQDVDISTNGALSVVGAQGGSIYALSSEGALLWQGNPSVGEISVDVSEDDAMVFGASSSLASNEVFAYSSAGTLVWQTVVDTRGWSIWNVAASNDGQIVAVQTNSDVIILDSQGNEIDFFDITSGNNLSDVDLSPDGAFMAVGFAESDQYFVAYYSLQLGELWRYEVGSYASARVDHHGNVIATARNDASYVFASDGDLLATWSTGGHNIDITPDGSRCVVGNFSSAKVYSIQNLP